MNARRDLRPWMLLLILAGLLMIAAGLLVPATVRAMPATSTPAMENHAAPAQSAGFSYTLYARWNLIGWLGGSNVDIIQALANNTAPDGDLSSRVVAIYAWEASSQSWKGFFPEAVGLAGVNDFDTFTQHTGYMIAISPGPSVTWTPPAQ
jgi:hypothetical protein